MQPAAWLQIDRDKQRLQFVRIWSKPLKRRADIVKRRRARIWAELIAEEHQLPFSPKRLIGNGLPIRGFEFKLPTDRGCAGR